MKDICFFYKFIFFFKKSLRPRFETEIFLELLSKIINYSFIKNVLDLGTGSGVIGLSISKDFLWINVLLVDKYKSVLKTAIKNSKIMSTSNSFFLLSNWFEKILEENSFDLIVSNPPYLSKNDIYFFKKNIECDPIFSLHSHNNGFGDLFRIGRKSFFYMNNNGIIVLEHGYSQAKYIRKFLILSGFLNVQTYFDNILLTRITIGEK